MTKPILSLQYLAWTIGIPLQRLKVVAKCVSEKPSSQYSSFTLKTGPSRIRHIKPPRAELKEIQARIVRNVLVPLGFAEPSHGSIRGRSARTNAEQHLGRPCFVKIDVASFFDNVGHRNVYRMFRDEFGFGRDVASLIARLVTFEGALPQGAPTSPSVANLFVRSVDSQLCASLPSGVRYTRYVDDLTFSGSNPRHLIGEAAMLLTRRGLPIKISKLVIAGRGSRQEVTGLVVNGSKRPTIARPYRDGVRAAIHQLRSESREEVVKSVRSIKGRIAHIRQFQPGVAKRLLRLLDCALEGQ